MKAGIDGTNYARWSSPEFEALNDEINQVTDPAQLPAMFVRGEAILAKEVPYAVTFSGNGFRIVSKDVEATPSTRCTSRRCNSCG